MRNIILMILGALLVLGASINQLLHQPSWYAWGAAQGPSWYGILMAYFASLWV